MKQKLTIKKKITLNIKKITNYIKTFKKEYN